MSFLCLLLIEWSLIVLLGCRLVRLDWCNILMCMKILLVYLNVFVKLKFLFLLNYFICVGLIGVWVMILGLSLIRLVIVVVLLIGFGGLIFCILIVCMLWLVCWMINLILDLFVIEFWLKFCKIFVWSKIFGLFFLVIIKLKFFVGLNYFMCLCKMEFFVVLLLVILLFLLWFLFDCDFCVLEYRFMM